MVDITTQTSKDTLDYIETHLQTQGTVYIAGGNAIIGSDFDSFLSSKGYRVKRLGGFDRYHTNLLIVNELKSTNETVFIASGENFPDVLSISSFASHTDSPILLTQTNAIPKEILDYLISKQPKQVLCCWWNRCCIERCGKSNQIGFAQLQNYAICGI